MKQRVSDKKRRYVESKTGKPIRSMWARGGREPRYWDVLFEDHTIGYWFPEQRKKLIGGRKIDTPEHLEMTDMEWKERTP